MQLAIECGRAWGERGSVGGLHCSVSERGVNVDKVPSPWWRSGEYTECARDEKNLN